MRKHLLLATASFLALATPAGATTIIAEQSFNTLDAGNTFTDDQVPDGGQLTNASSFNISSDPLNLGFRTFWFDTRGNGTGPSVGSESGDFIGVNAFSGSNAPDLGPTGIAVSAGVEQNFEFNDGDGRLDLVFDSVDLSGQTNRQLSFDYFINDTGFESNDSLSASLSDGSISANLFSLGESGLEGQASSDSSPIWQSINVDLDQFITDNGLGENLTLTISADTNSGSENIFVDNIAFFTGEIGDPDPDPGPMNLAIYEIQGSGFESAFQGEQVETSGVVIGVADDGFFLQDPNGDGDIATSDGIFVETGSTPSVAIGDAVSVTGLVSEQFGRTHLDNATDIVVGSSGNSIDPLVLGPDGRTPETENLAEGRAFYESLEGMLVTLPDAQAVSNNNRFDEFYAIGNRGADATGTNARGGITISGPITEDNPTGDLNPERIQIDDNLATGQNTEVGIGDGLGDVTGVVDFNFNDYSIAPLNPVGITDDFNLQAESSALAADEAGQLSVASYNVLNLGGDDDDRIQALAQQIVDNLNSPDILALQEIQDNNGELFGGGADADQTLQAIADAIFALTGETYAFIDNPFITEGETGGQPGGNIRVTYLYNTAEVSFVEGSLETITDPAQQAAGNGPFANSRLPLVARFIELDSGQEITLINNHFSSRGGSDPLFGPTQPPQIGNELDRLAQAMAVRDFVTALLETDPSSNVAVLGDLNGFQFENFVQLLLGSAFEDDVIDIEALMAELQLFDLSQILDPTDRYSFIFEGNAQLLDHFLISQALLESFLAYDIVHLGSEFLDQVSDHDALLALFAFQPIPVPAPVWFLACVAALAAWRRRARA